MKATYSHNGKCFIYKVDGQQVRTSTRVAPFECVAVQMVDGKFSRALAFGKAKTCEYEVSARFAYKRIMEINLRYFKGEITYREYFHAVGFSHAMTREFMEEERRDRKEENVDALERRLEDYTHLEFKVIRFEQE